MSAGEEEFAGPGEGGGEAPAPAIDTPKPEVVEAQETRAVTLGSHWRLRRFLITSAIFLALWFLMIALIVTGTPPSVYFVFLLPFYLITLLFALRKPKALRPKKQKSLKQRLTFANRLTIAIVTFIVVYLPFSFISNKIIPFAPVVEFGLFVAALYILYRLAGRSVGVAASLEALPPANHRRHKQVVLPIDDPHYQRTLFLNYEFVDSGRGARTLAKRLENAMEALGVEPERRHSIVEDLEDYREGLSFNFGLTRTSRERRSNKRERRSQLLTTVYNKFNLELEQGA